MKTLIALALLIAATIAAQAQSVKIILISNDGSIQATNQVTLSADKVSGLISKWNLDSKSKTNAGSAALTFNAFIFQEITDKGAEWTLQAGRDALKAAGVTNSIPDKAALLWAALNATQQTNVVNYLNQLGQ